MSELVVGAPSDLIWTQKTPEMNELETNKKHLKIWAHNFEKQKSYRDLILLPQIAKRGNSAGGGLTQLFKNCVEIAWRGSLCEPDGEKTYTAFCILWLVQNLSPNRGHTSRNNSPTLTKPVKPIFDCCQIHFDFALIFQRFHRVLFHSLTSANERSKDGVLGKPSRATLNAGRRGCTPTQPLQGRNLSMSPKLFHFRIQNLGCCTRPSLCGSSGKVIFSKRGKWIDRKGISGIHLSSSSSVNFVWFGWLARTLNSFCSNYIFFKIWHHWHQDGIKQYRRGEVGMFETKDAIQTILSSLAFTA